MDLAWGISFLLGLMDLVIHFKEIPRCHFGIALPGRQVYDPMTDGP